MAIFEIKRNARVLIHEEPHRLTKRLPDGTWQLEHERSGHLCEHGEQQLLEMLRTGVLEYAFDRDPTGDKSSADQATVEGLCVRSAWDAASEAERKEARRHLRYVDVCVDGARSKEFMKPLIRSVGCLLKDPQRPSVSTVNRWCHDYIAGGRDIVALLPRVKERGNRTDRIGTPMRALIMESLDAKYLTRTRPTLQDALDDAVARVARTNRMRPEGDEQMPLPTMRRLQSVLSGIDPYERCAARYGREYAEHKFRQVLGYRRIERGMQRVEIDHTLINVMVVDERTFLPLGRPCLTLAADVRHRTALGYALSFEPPSYLSILRCLRHAILPKTYIKDRYPRLQHAWLCFGVMESVGLDNGKDFHAEALQDFAGRYGIALDYCPIRRPWMKGTIERLLGFINRAVAHGVPGTTFANLFERGDYQSPGQPHGTDEESRGGRPHLDHVRLLPLPGASRSWECRHRGNRKKEMRNRVLGNRASAIQLDQDLAVPDERTLTHEGIELDHLFYNSRALRPLLARGNGRLKVAIRKSPEDLGQVAGVRRRHREVHRRADHRTLRRLRQGAVALAAHGVRALRQAPVPGPRRLVALAEAKNRVSEIVERGLRAKSKATRARSARYAEAGQAAQAMSTTPKPVNRRPALPGVKPARPPKKVPVAVSRLAVSFVSRRF